MCCLIVDFNDTDQCRLLREHYIFLLEMLHTDSSLLFQLTYHQVVSHVSYHSSWNNMYVVSPMSLVN